MDERKTVMEFIDEARDLPQKLTVESSASSQYLFHLLIRFYCKKLGFYPTFCPYSKQTESGIRSVIEEHLIMEDGRLYVLSGCDISFVNKLKPPKGTYVLAEATGGELKTERYRYFERKDILRALLTVLGMKMSLRALLAGDWSAMLDYGDFEAVLRKAKAAGWTEEETVESLESGQRVPFLTGIKRGRFEDILRLVDLRGETFVFNAIQEAIVFVLRYKFLKLMGHDDDRILKELDLGRYRLRELVEEAAALTISELENLVKEVVSGDRLFTRNKSLGLDLVLLNSSVRLTR